MRFELIVMIFALVCLWAPPLAAKPIEKDGEPLRLHAPEGQLASHPLRIFVNRKLSAASKPTITLTDANSFLPERVTAAPIEATYVASGQSFTANVAGQQVSSTGTLLLFDLPPDLKTSFKPAVRYEPIVQWGQPGQANLVIGQSIYVGYVRAASAWTTLILMMIVGTIVGLACLSEKKPIELLSGEDGKLSLWRVQIALWTLAIGGTVIFHGMVRWEVPAIPDSLVLLMGMSSLTGGLSHMQDKKDLKSRLNARAGTDLSDLATPTDTAKSVLEAQRALPRVKPTMQDLLMSHDNDELPNLSISRAQLLFWTIITLGLFVGKSIVQGGLWDVPTQMIALMGLSQLSYLSPKIFAERLSLGR